MSLLERGLSKLTISAWKDREGKIPLGKMSVMYNPDSIQLDYRTRYRTEETINKSAQSNRYVISEPAGLNINLLFDSQMPGNNTPLEKQLARLKSLCAVNAGTDSPCFLRITWGRMRWENKGWFAGRASELSVTYTLFDRDATPLRATVRLGLVADESFVIQQNEKLRRELSTVLIDVPDLASLSLLAISAGATLAGGTEYLSLAWDNDLDNLDDFEPGSVLQANEGTGL
ncbi:CIS tube protein [Enterobacter ludwigii]